MSKKNSTENWRCDICPDWDENPYVCPHLEKLIAEPNTSNIPISYRSDMDQISNEGPMLHLPKRVLDGYYERSFRKKLKKYGCNQLQADIITMRFMDNMTLKDIAEELAIVSQRQVLNIINNTLKDLRKRGFK